MFEDKLITKAEDILALCLERNLTIVTAESCTGGLLSALFTAIPDSSKVFERGFVTYSNSSKHQLLGVPSVLINDNGAVSKEVALSMAKGAITYTQADISIAITGIAGPGGGTNEKPVGTVHIACASRFTSPLHTAKTYDGNRHDIRLHAVEGALLLLSKLLAK